MRIKIPDELRLSALEHRAVLLAEKASKAGNVEMGLHFRWKEQRFSKAGDELASRNIYTYRDCS